MKSINVGVDDYLPPSDTYRPEDSPMVLVHKKEKTHNSPKDTSLSSGKENYPDSTDIWTIPEFEHLVIEEVQASEVMQQHMMNKPLSNRQTSLHESPLRRFIIIILPPT